MGVKRGEMPAGAGGDPAAERRELKRLREVAQCQVVLRQLLLQSRPRRARLDPGGERDRVDLQNPIQGLHVHGHRPRVIVAHARFDSTDDARAAAERDHRGAGRDRPIQNSGELMLVARLGDDVGRVVKPAVEGPDDVAIGAPVRMQGTLVGARRADRGQGAGRLQPDGRQHELAQRHRRLRI